MRMEKKKLPLPIQIFIGLVLGIIAGLCLMKTPHIATAYIPVSYTHLDVYKRQPGNRLRADPGGKGGTVK